MWKPSLCCMSAHISGPWGPRPGISSPPCVPKIPEQPYVNLKTNLKWIQVSSICLSNFNWRKLNFLLIRKAWDVITGGVCTYPPKPLEKPTQPRALFAASTGFARTKEANAREKKMPFWPSFCSPSHLQSFSC